MFIGDRRFDIEKKTVTVMIRLYCSGMKHSDKVLCNECNLLLAYASERLDACPFGENKPVCCKCTVHCYKSDMRHKIKAVMRYSGPRMLLRYPVLMLKHFLHMLQDQ